MSTTKYSPRILSWNYCRVGLLVELLEGVGWRFEGMGQTVV